MSEITSHGAEYMALAFSIPRLGNFEGSHLVTKGGEHIAYKLSGRWQVRVWDDKDFFHGRLLHEYESAIEMARWLNDNFVCEAAFYERIVRTHLDPSNGI